MVIFVIFIATAIGLVSGVFSAVSERREGAARTVELEPVFLLTFFGLACGILVSTLIAFWGVLTTPA